MVDLLHTIEPNEQARLAALDRYDVLDTPREEAFDRIVRLTKQILQVPIATVSLIDGHRQWHKSFDGLATGEAPRGQTFCTHTIREGQALVVPDAASDPRFAENPYVLGNPGIRFYAGIPLTTSDGHHIGTLCAIDTVPREMKPDQAEALGDLARITMDALEMRLLASKDALTGALSRRAFKEECARAVALALRHHAQLSCIVLDIDEFKRINDSHGHPAGDAVLVAAVAACQKELRVTDRIGRLGGDEFAVLLPHTDRNGAMEAAEKLRIAISQLPFDLAAEPRSVTASFGVASLGGGAQSVDELLANADSALYVAKAAGRNCCRAWQPPATEVSRPMRRVLKGGQILFNNHNSSIDCTVRSLSDDGAGIDVFDTVAVPKLFDLAIKSDGFERACRVLARTEKHLDVQFC